jgi:hypothetical protein
VYGCGVRNLEIRKKSAKPLLSPEIGFRHSSPVTVNYCSVCQIFEYFLLNTGYSNMNMEIFIGIIDVHYSNIILYEYLFKGSHSLNQLGADYSPKTLRELN